MLDKSDTLCYPIWFEKGEIKMPYSTTHKPKILRTQLTDEMHSRFKMLAAELRMTMAELMESMIADRIREWERSKNGN